MPNREKVINCLTDIEQIMVCRQEICPREELQYWIELQEGVADALALLKEQEKQKFFVDENGKITPLPVVVRCKDCKHRGKIGKCVVASIAAEKDYKYPICMLDNRGEWFCADGEKAVSE